MTAETSLVIEKLSFVIATGKPQPSGIFVLCKPGEILLIAGASGCGKTTLIRCINGLIPRSYKGELSGRILLNGDDTRLAAGKNLPDGWYGSTDRTADFGTKVLHEVAFGPGNLAMPRRKSFPCG